MSNREAMFRLALGGIIVVLYVVSTVVDAVNPEYDPPTGLGTLMSVVTTSYFAAPVIKEIRRRTAGNGVNDE